jgi:predicted O-methyltransferase YrrM
MNEENVWTAVEAALREAPGEELSWIQPPPPSDGWTLAPDALRFLSRLVPALSPSHVLEFGSGLSTRVLARACGRLSGRRAISSVDHDPEFGSAAAKAFAAAAAAPASVRVRFQIAPVVARECGGRLLPVYRWRSSAFASRRPVDLVLIDGPPVTLGGREGTLYQAMDHAQPGTLALLDDTIRPEERMTVTRWQQTLGDAVETRELPGFSKGMAAVLIRRPVRRAELWQHQRDLCVRELGKALPAGAAYGLADDQLWDAEPVADCRLLPFLGYSPVNDDEALRALDRLRRDGADFFVATWESFWWRNQYPRLLDRLERDFPRVADSALLIVFDLRGPKAE